MPVTIGSLTSNVNVMDGNNLLSEEMIEQIVKRVMVKLKEEMRAEESFLLEGEIPDRMSKTLTI